MKNLYCKNCGILVAKLEAGSTVKKDSVMFCGDCNINSEPNFDDNNFFGEDATIQNLKNIFGMI